MDLSVITVTWNSEKTIAEQIRSVILGCKEISFEQFVVDNGSTDQTTAIIEKNFSHLKLVKKNINTGFSAANNEAAAQSSGEFLLFLNPDMRVEEGSLDIMAGWMRRHREVGIASPKLVNERGEFEEQGKPRRFPELWDQILVLLKIPHLFPRVLDKYFYKDFNPNKEQEVDSVRGAFLLMRRELYQKLGFAFDPRYFIWFEDVDTCREAKRLGFKVVYTPVVSCVDQVGTSFRQRGFIWKQWQFIRSMAKYFWKWGGLSLRGAKRRGNHLD